MAFSDLLTADEQELAEHYPNRAEHTADGIVHAVGILAALVGGGLLVAVALVNRGVPMATAGAIYAMCLMAMLAASAVRRASSLRLNIAWPSSPDCFFFVLSVLPA